MIISNVDPGYLPTQHVEKPEPQLQVVDVQPAVRTAEHPPAFQAQQVRDEEAGAEIADDQLGAVVTQLNDAAQIVRSELNFRVDDDSGRTVVTVTNLETGEVVRQIPTEEVLVRARKTADSDASIDRPDALIFDDKV